MTRYIDTLPYPAHIEPKKLIILSTSRSGTLGLYKALTALGFKPFHMVEVFNHGVEGVELLQDAIDATYKGKGKPYGLKEFDKWFAEYDIINEMPHLMVESFIQAYPDAKFLLTERDPDRWVKSLMQTIGAFADAGRAFPMSLLNHFDEYNDKVFKLTGDIMDIYTKGKEWDSEEGRRNSRQFYVDYIAKVKKLVPREQLKVVKLEDGLDWQDICTYLDVPIPDAKWPTQHNAEEFKQNMWVGFMRRGFLKSVSIASAVVVPSVGVGVWYLWKWLT